MDGVQNGGSTTRKVFKGVLKIIKLKPRKSQLNK